MADRHMKVKPRPLAVIVVPLNAVPELGDVWKADPDRSFAHVIDADVDLTHDFLNACRMTLHESEDKDWEVPTGTVKGLADDSHEDDGGKALPIDVHSMRILVVEFDDAAEKRRADRRHERDKHQHGEGGTATKGDGNLPDPDDDAELETAFGLIEISPKSDDNLEDWIEMIRVATGKEAGRYFARELGATMSDDDRPVAVFSLFSTSGSLDETCRQLATRAPVGEAIVECAREEVRLVGNQRRVVSPRNCGFVTTNDVDSDFFRERFRGEVATQYVAAVVFARWQRIHLNAILTNADQMWRGSGDDESPVQRLLSFIQPERRSPRISSLRDRFEDTVELRRRHARLMASGIAGPVFESSGLRDFWAEVAKVYSLRSRQEAAESALSALSETAETEANLKLEWLVILFTIVIGIPSLVFTVLGVNISRYTTSPGVRLTSVMEILAACMLAGLAIFWWVTSRPRRTGSSNGGKRSARTKSSSSQA